MSQTPDQYVMSLPVWDDIKSGCHFWHTCIPWSEQNLLRGNIVLF